MQTKEQYVFDALEQNPYYAILGGKKVRMLPSTLSDDQYVGAIISKFPDLNNEDIITPDDIVSLLNAKDLAKIISRTAKSRAWFYPFRIFSTWVRRKRAFYLAYKKASKIELNVQVTRIIPEMRLFFYRNCIITLKKTNTIKPTKKTDPTALG